MKTIEHINCDWNKQSKFSNLWISDEILKILNNVCEDNKEYINQIIDFGIDEADILEKILTKRVIAKMTFTPDTITIIFKWKNSYNKRLTIEKVSYNKIDPQTGKNLWKVNTFRLSQNWYSNFSKYWHRRNMFEN